MRSSESPYSFQLVLVPKKNGERGRCVEYRPLNKIMVRDSFPAANIDDCFVEFANNKYLTTLDLKIGFHHIRIHEDSIKYTAFVTPDGHYEYLVMPFG